MGRYCLLQCKRIARYLPGVLLAMLVLLGGLMAAFSFMVRQDSPGDHKFQVAMVGTADDMMVQMGLTALRTFDSTQLSMEILEMTEPEAQAALEKGAIGAYVVIPEEFVEEAMQGHIIPLKFVSTTGAASVVSVFKEEVTDVVSLLLLESQRGVYGMQGAMKSQDIGGRGKKWMSWPLPMWNIFWCVIRSILCRSWAFPMALGWRITCSAAFSCCF